MEEGKKVNLTTSEKSNNNQTNYKGKIIEQHVIRKELKCFLCKKAHMKKDCIKFKN